MPVESKAMMSQLQLILDTCLADRRNAWDMQPDGRYVQRTGPVGEQGISGDEETMPVGTHGILMDQVEQRAAKTVGQQRLSPLKANV